MTSWDILALGSSLTAATFLLLRRHMLAGRLQTWHSAPAMVQASLAVMALYMGMVFFSVLGGWHATPREAVAYLVLAATSVVMVINLDRNGRAEPQS